MNLENEDMIFDRPDKYSSIIKVIGVGGGGGNAVAYMCKQGIKDVDFVVCNTDLQALEANPVLKKIQMGKTLTEGRGAGSIPEKGEQAAIESMDTITDVLRSNTKMVFITAGMGGGTGTGAVPIIAKTAKEMDILTVVVLTIPFRFEGKKRCNQAIKGIHKVKDYTDSLLIINNETLKEVHSDLKLTGAFARADDVLATAVKGIAEIITVHGYINVDFADVKTVMKDSGVAILGSAKAIGKERAVNAVKKALNSPLLNNNDIQGAKNVVLNITYGEKEITMDEVGKITDFVQNSVGDNVQIIWGAGQDLALEEEVSVTVIATGFDANEIPDLADVPERVEILPRTRKHVQTIDENLIFNFERSASKNVFVTPNMDEKTIRTFEKIPAYKRRKTTGNKKKVDKI